MDDPLFRFRLHIPDEFGTVAQYYQADSGERKVVCLVQVIGPSEQEADANLARILEIYLRDAGIDLICWESAEGELALNKMQHALAVPRVLAKHQSCKYLFWQTLKATKSPIKALRAARSTVMVFGVDNMRWHGEMTAVQHKALSSWPKYRPVFDRLKELFQSALAGITTPEVEELVFLEQGWENGTLRLVDLSRRLVDLAGRARVQLPTEARKCLVANIRDTQIQSDKVEGERDELLTRMQHAARMGFAIQEDMVPQLLSEAMEESATTPAEQLLQAHRHVRKIVDHLAMPALDVTKMKVTVQSDTTPLGGYNPLSQTIEKSAMYFREIFDVATVLGVDLSPYPNLARYVEQINLLSSITGTGFVLNMTEKIDLAFHHLEGQLVSTARERELLAARRRLDLLERLAQLVLSQEHYDRLAMELDVCFLEKIIKLLTSRKEKLAPALHDRAREFDKERDNYCIFYDRARKRASRMADETLRLMQEHQTEQAILICLGFHVRTICSIFAGNEVSFTVIHPKFTL